MVLIIFFFQAEDGIRDRLVTGVQTCALPISLLSSLTIMENAESESEVLGLGLSVIALNLGMYIGLPAFGILKLYQIRKN